MSWPVVAIVGRPNVGKSSLFNALAGRRISIVEPTAGVTRDRIATQIESNGKWFELVDTGGIGIVDSDALEKDVEKQIDFALASASVIVFVVDIRAGIAPLDEEVAEKLRVLGKPLIFVANKADDARQDVNMPDLFRLGYGEPILVSANSRRNCDDLLVTIAEKLPIGTEGPPTDVALKIAIVGRRNVGKSTFINSLAKEERVIVSEVAGTTRDSIDVRFERDGQTYLAIDTAGVRKKSSIGNSIEYYSLHRAERSIRRADVVMHFFDSRLKIGRVDKQLAEYVIDNHKPSIFVINKWDLVKDAMATGTMGDYVRKIFPMLDYVPIAFVTAKESKNTMRVLQLASQLHKQAGRRITTGELNRLLSDATNETAPPVRGSAAGRIFYAAQVGENPPTIALVTNGKQHFDDTYLRYLMKYLRDRGPYGEVPMKFILRTRGESSGGTSKEPAPIPVEMPPPPKPKKKKQAKTWDL